MLNLHYLPISSVYRRSAALSESALFAELGWADRSGLPGYVRNDALLLSLALIASGVSVPGRFPIGSGRLVGSKAETSAHRLIEYLKSRHQFPEAITFEGDLETVADQLFARRGIVAFIRDAGHNGARLDLLNGHNAHLVCREVQVLPPLEILFWPLD
ncbi:hypothetical protein [Quatrionicoccus australiensis]|uniref:hypothetical protein n=1 Tax=Quatrionicoccus australiensis TaxID=138118 RepID=UPI001CFBDFBA|nr:hypothetical protein [Quatrionicoccus australiensis]MCB4359499.1 hypothetical protein [Quatrionicoccus australiensis]